MNTILLVHIFGAIGLLLVSASSLFGLSTRRLKTVGFYAKALAYGMVFQVVSGSLLAISSDTAAGSFCAKIGLYFALWVAMEFMLFVYSKNNKIVFPGKAVSFAVAPALASYAITLIYLI